jgi:hypothetical protein
MQPIDPKERPPWRPRVDEDQEVNPSVRRTAPGSDVEEDQPTLSDIERENQESEAREDDPEPIKIP